MSVLRLAKYALSVVSILVVLCAAMCLLLLFSMMLQQDFALKDFSALGCFLLCFCCSILALRHGGWYLFAEGGFVVAGLFWTLAEMRRVFDELNALDDIDVNRMTEGAAIVAFYKLYDMAFSAVGVVVIMGSVLAVATLRFVISKKVE